MFSVGVISPSWLVPIFERQELALSPLHDLASPGSHDEDMHETDLVGMNGISHVSMIFIRQQNECP
jgi:hypothetical protein